MVKISAPKNPKLKNEQYYIDDIINNLSTRLNRMYGQNRYERFFHAKSHGLVKAKIEVNDNLPNELRKGLFKSQTSYDAWLRFSNANSRISSDKKKGVRGLSIKIINIPGTHSQLEVQDIVLTTSEVLCPGTVRGQWIALNILFRKRWWMLPMLIFHLKGLLGFLKGFVKPSCVLAQSYRSLSPFAFGNDNIVRWLVMPLDSTHNVLKSKNESENFLSEKLADDLNKQEHLLGLYIELPDKKKTGSLENAAIKWKSGPVFVATIRLLKQDIRAEENIKMEQAILFSPANSIEEHVAIGGINRLRIRVYEVLSRYRINHNNNVM